MLVPVSEPKVAMAMSTHGERWSPAFVAAATAAPAVITSPGVKLPTMKTFSSVVAAKTIGYP